MKLSQSSLSIIGIVCAVIWLGCGADDDDRVDHLTIESSLLSPPKIAFVSDRERKGGVYVINADGTNVVNLIKHQGENYHPDWSPDGTKIAFDRLTRHEGNSIYVMNADGTNVVKITGNETYDTTPAWSSDGTKIAFTRWGGGGHDDICVMNADGTNVVNITKDGRGNYDPAWSPDGKKIAFQKDKGIHADIYVMNADGTDLVKITNNLEYYDGSPTWSPRH